MKCAIESHRDYEAFRKDGDPIALLKAIQEISHGCELHQYLPLQLYEAKRKLFILTQKRGQSLQYYDKGFQAQLDVIQSLGRSFDGKDLISWAYRKDGIDPYTATENQPRHAAQTSSEAFESIAFLSGADKNKYGRMFDDLENDQMKNVYSFPKTLIDAYNFLSRWKDRKHRHFRSDLSDDGVNFTTRDDTNNNEEHIINPEKETALATKGKATNKTKSKTIICYKCGEDGHLSPNCPNLNKKDEPSENEEQSMSGNQLLMQGIHNHLETYSFSSQGIVEDHGRVKNVAANKHNISQDWILFDNQSTVDVFINPKLVKDIRVTDTIMHIHCHSGTSSTRLQATLPDMELFGLIQKE
jgi:hypothetical protein